LARVRIQVQWGEWFRDGIHSPYRIQQEVRRRLGAGFRNTEKGSRIGRQAVDSEADNSGEEEKMTAWLAAALPQAAAVEADFSPVAD